MRPVPMLAWRLLAGSGGRGALTTALSALAVAVTTALMLLVLGVALGFEQRADREAWLNPRYAEGDATAIMAVSSDFVRDQPIVVVELAQLDESAPAPPGLERFPAPGEVWLSPDLTSLVAEIPAGELGNRFAGDATGTFIAGQIGDQALVYPDQLMAIIGRDQEHMDRSLAGMLWSEPFVSSPTPITSFEGRDPIWRFGYRALSTFAAALVVVPLVVLGSAAGRLSTAYRDRRLAAMRLVGATPGQVMGVTMFETALIGLTGALLGLGIYAATLPLTSQVQASGGTWFVSDLWVGWPFALAALVLVPVIVVFSALLGFRRLIVSPLGVARRQRSSVATVWRLLLFMALLVAFILGAQDLGRANGVWFGALFAILFLGLSIAGPFLMRILGWVMVLFARGPSTLLAGRRIVDDPYSVWRTVGSLALTGFVAGFLMIIVPANMSWMNDRESYLDILVDESQATEVIDQLRAAAGARGLDVNVSSDPDSYWMGLDDQLHSTVTVVVNGDAAARDQMRTIIWETHGSTPPVSGESQAWRGRTETGDVRVAAMLVLSVSLAVACVSAMITGVTGILDRRQTLSSLRLSGVPLRVLDAARIRETLVPFLMVGGGAVAAGIICALPLAAIAGVSGEDRSLTLFLIPAGVALVGLAIAEIASRITLRSATANPTAHRL